MSNNRKPAIDHGKMTPFTWWLRKLDIAFGKPDEKDLIVLSGYPSVGKTEFTHFVARANADLWNLVAYLSLEMPKEKLAERYACKKAGVSRLDFQEKKYTEEQAAIIDKEYEAFLWYKNIVMIGEEKTRTMSELLSNQTNTKKWKLDELYDFGCRLFVIDNLGKIDGDLNELIRFDNISSKLQQRKNKTWATVILLHHMAKPQRGNQYVPWWVAGIRWSQKIIDNATQVFEIFRDLDPENTDPKDKATTTLYQYKNTMGGTNGMAEIFFNGEYVEDYHGPLPEKKIKAAKSFYDTDRDNEDIPF